MQSPPSTRLSVVIQPAGLHHRFIRNKDTSTIVERPERLRAVAVGVAAAAARLENFFASTNAPKSIEPADDLADALERLTIVPPAVSTSPFDILTATGSIDLVTDGAVRFVHGEPAEYTEKLAAWASGSEDKIRNGESEIPAGLSQGDLYSKRHILEMALSYSRQLFQCVREV